MNRIRTGLRLSGILLSCMLVHVCGFSSTLKGQPRTPTRQQNQQIVQFSDSGKGEGDFTHSLFFPFIQHDAAMASRIGVINLTNDEISIEFTYYDHTGEPVLDPLSLNLSPRGRFFQAVTDAPLATPIWCRVDATGPIGGYLSLLSQDHQRSVFVKGVTRLENLLYVPHIAPEVDYWNTYTSLVHVENAAGTDANPFFDYVAGMIALPDPVKPNSQYYFEWEKDLFEGVFPEGMNFWGKLLNNTAYSVDIPRATLAAAEFFEREGEGIEQLCGLDLQAEASKTLYFPHIHVQGGYWWTGIALENVSTSAADVVLTPYDSNGNALTSVNYEMAASEKLVKLAQSFWEDKGAELPEGTAWIHVTTSSGRLIGYELFGTLQAAGNTLLTAVNAPGSGDRMLLYPHISDDPEEWTGIVALNIGTEQSSVTVEARDDSGTILGTHVLETPLQPNQKWVRLARDIFPGGLPKGTTMLVLEATMPMTGFELWGDEIESKALTVKQHLSGMLAQNATPVVFREGFENVVDLQYLDGGITDGWMLAQFADDTDGDFGWDHATMIGFSDGSWYDEKWPQTIPAGRDYMVGFYGDMASGTYYLNHELLISPLIHLPVDATTLLFDSQYGWAGYYTVADTLYIAESLTGDAEAIVSAATPLYSPGASAVAGFPRSTQPALVGDDFTRWQRIELDISSYAGRSIRLLFEINSLYEESWHIDNIEVK